MGLATSIAKESIERKYRVLSKDELTLLIYKICKNTMAKWVYPLRNPEEVTQVEINKFLDTIDFSSKKFRMNFPSIQKSYEVPYDFYLRGLYRFAENLETNIGTNMDKVLFEKVIGQLYGDSAKCISKLDMREGQANYFKYTFNDKFSSEVIDEKTGDMAEAILDVYSKCKYGAIIVSSYEQSNQRGHRTLIYIENNNNVLNVFYYDPHGSSKYSWSNKYKVYDSIYKLFDFMRLVMDKFGIQDIVINRYDTICLFGVQAMSYKYDIGMCQIYSSLWLYNVSKIIAETTKNNIILPNKADWLYLVDDYFINEFNMKQRYNAVLLFVSRLFNFYAVNNKKYLAELEKYNNYLLDQNQKDFENFEVPYEMKSPDEIKEMDDYIVRIAKEGIAAKRKEEQEAKRGIKPVRTRKRIAEEPVDESYKEYKKRVKIQKKMEEEYDKSVRSYLPFSKRKLFEECSSSSDCLSGCCYKSEIDGQSYCNESQAC